MSDRVPLEYIGDDEPPFELFANGVGWFTVDTSQERVYHFPPETADALLHDRPDRWAEWTGKPRKAVDIEPD